MKQVNYEYIKLNKYLIFLEIVKASDEEDDKKLEFFQKIIRTILTYEKTNREHINEFYIRISDLEKQEYLKIKEITVERQTILNAILFAVFNNDIETLKKLTSIPIHKNEIPQSELGDNLDYILNHSIDLNEYIMGENERIIYSDKKNTLEKGYIYNLQENKSYQRLRLK